MPRNFSYIIPGKLAGCARPGGFGDLDSDLQSLERRGIGAVVSLTEDALDADVLRNFGFRYLHLPIPDFQAPHPNQIADFLAFTDNCLGEGTAVAVHCGAGMGRTGTMLACYLVHAGLAPAEAIRMVRGKRPGSIETREQERSVRDFCS